MKCTMGMHIYTNTCNPIPALYFWDPDQVKVRPQETNKDLPKLIGSLCHGMTAVLASSTRTFSSALGLKLDSEQKQ